MYDGVFHMPRPIGMPAPKFSRISNISFHASRLLRHGPDAKRREPQLNIDLTDGAVQLDTLAKYHNLQAYSRTTDDLRQAANGPTLAENDAWK